MRVDKHVNMFLHNTDCSEQLMTLNYICVISAKLQVLALLVYIFVDLFIICNVLVFFNNFFFKDLSFTYIDKVYAVSFHLFSFVFMLEYNGKLYLSLSISDGVEFERR